MGDVRLSITMSLDGFVAGPNQSAEHPFGIGGVQLHQWLLPLKAFRETDGEEGGEINAEHGDRRGNPRQRGRDHHGSKHVRRRAQTVGRRSFEGLLGPTLRTDTRSSCSPAIRAGLEMEGGTRFYFGAGSA
jgi:hypothetical protein